MEPGAAASYIPAAIAAAGSIASIASQFGGSKTPKVQTESAPTIDTAADAVAATNAENAKRRSWQTDSGSTQLTPVGGVQSDLTGTRMLTSAR